MGGLPELIQVALGSVGSRFIQRLVPPMGEAPGVFFRLPGPCGSDKFYCTLNGKMVIICLLMQFQGAYYRHA